MTLKRIDSLLTGSFEKEVKAARSNNYRQKRDQNSGQEAFDFLQLIRSWEEVIGPRLYQHTIPLKNTRNTLTILTDHPAFSEQLKFMEQELIKKIIRIFPSLRYKLKELRFITDTTYFRKQKEMAEKAGHRVDEESVSAEESRAKEENSHRFSPKAKKLKKEADEFFSDLELGEDGDEITDALKSIFIQSKQSE